MQQVWANQHILSMLPAKQSNSTRFAFMAVMCIFDLASEGQVQTLIPGQKLQVKPYNSADAYVLWEMQT